MLNISLRDVKDYWKFQRKWKSTVYVRQKWDDLPIRVARRCNGYVGFNVDNGETMTVYKTRNGSGVSVLSKSEWNRQSYRVLT